MWIESITTTRNQRLEIGKISILVGPNNCGKSQTLRDIKERMVLGMSSKPVLLNEINFEVPASHEEILKNLDVTNNLHNPNRSIRELKHNLLEQDSYEFRPDWIEQQFDAKQNYDFLMGTISKFRVALLDSSTRLELVKTVPGFNPNEDKPTTLLQALLMRKESETLLRNAFRDAFIMDIRLDWSSFVKLSLLIAKDMPIIPDNPQEAFPITRDLNKIDDEGDGYRSFVGIILGILLSKDRIILLDEPEAFLHPAQSRSLGKWIADSSDKFKGQLIVATHSSYFLSGVLSSDKSVDIYRLNRNANQTSYNLIPPDATKQLTKSSILSSQRVLEAIFHRGVVVCEGDKDRAIYHGVSISEFDNHEVLFVHSHNKQTLAVVAKLLLDAGIPVSVVADIDLLNSPKDFKELVELLGRNNYPKLLKLREEISFSINKRTDEEILLDLKQKVAEFLEQLENGDHTYGGARGAMNRIRNSFTKWDLPKTRGVEGFDIEIRPKVWKVLKQLATFGLFIVPVGEVEGWIDLGVARNKWIVPALDKVYKKESPANLKRFIKTIVKWVDTANVR